MKLQEIQSCKCTSQVHIPFSTCWSDDNYVAMATNKGIHIMGGRWKARKQVSVNSFFLHTLFILCLLTFASATDITSNVFGQQSPMIPAAFGDFNSDEYPDLFVIRDAGRSIEILLGGDTEPLIGPSTKKNRLQCSFDYLVTSIVPGDFDGDAIMDVMVTLGRPTSGLNCSNDDDVQEVRVLWGSGDSLMCNAKWAKPLLMCGQPLAMDWNMDMIIDLFGEAGSARTYWVFNNTRVFPKVIRMTSSDANRPLSKLRVPHSHAFLDLNGDYNPDMFVTTTNGYEIWLKSPEDREDFIYSGHPYKFPEGAVHLGQSLFIDSELKGKIDQLIPVCYNTACTNSSILVNVNNKWVPLRINFHDKANNLWGFVPPARTSILQNVINLHAGDYNMDGYPDLLATLKNGNNYKTFLLTNDQCVVDCHEYSRTFSIVWNELSPMNNNTQMGVFYDFMQDGILDIIFVKNGSVTAFKNNLDYDANFLKVMVITGIKDQKQPVIPNPTGRRNRTYGTNLPGPLISYNSTNQDDEPRASVSAQLPQSAYLSLLLPYTLFGLGRTPNFVDKVTVGVYGRTRYWTQLIPNSQMVVIPIPLSDPVHWMARLFVTPSKLIVKSFIALLGICFLLSIIIAVLWWKERREDHHERRQESHRFHYDGM